MHPLIIRNLMRFWPFPYGSGRIIDRCFSGVSFTKSPAAVRTTDGPVLNVLPNDHIGRHICLSGEFDRSTLSALLKFAKPGDKLLDIGANIGYVSACFLANVERSTVIAVEPQPGITDLLYQNMAQFGSRAEIVPFALSECDGDGWLDIKPHNLGASRLTNTKTDSSVKVQLLFAQKFFDTYRKIDLIKIDVEGHEEAILLSSADALKRLKPRAILFEDHNAAAASSSTLGSFLRSLDYSIYGIKKRLTGLKYVPVEHRKDCKYNDYIAVRGQLFPIASN